MKRTIIIASAALAAALLTASFAIAGTTGDDHGSSAVAKECAAQKKADKVAFTAVYGDHAMRTCIHGPADASGTEFKNAAKDCKGQREADPVAFQETYGSIHSKGHNAFGKCVSSTVKHPGGGDTV